VPLRSFLDVGGFHCNAGSEQWGLPGCLAPISRVWLLSNQEKISDYPSDRCASVFLFLPGYVIRPADPLVAAEEGVMPMSMSPAERSLRAKIGAHALHSKYDGTVVTERARAKFMSSFERQVDPEGVLPEAERLRRADHARRAHMAKLALRSARVRAARAAGKKTTP
jgi:hypothetical protein